MSDHGLPPDTRGGQDVIDRYRLGVVVEPISREDEKYRGTLVLPYLTRRGVKAVKFRNLRGYLDGEKPDFKYFAPKWQPSRLYNVEAYFLGDSKIGLAEGEIDAIVATERLGIPTIGVPGAQMWQANGRIWASLFKNYEQVLVLADGDPPQERKRPDGAVYWVRPGEELANAIGASLKTKARTVMCPEPEDVSSMVASGRMKELTDQIFEEDKEPDEDTDDMAPEEDIPPF